MDLTGIESNQTGALLPWTHLLVPPFFTCPKSRRVVRTGRCVLLDQLPLRPGHGHPPPSSPPCGPARQTSTVSPAFKGHRPPLRGEHFSAPPLFCFRARELCHCHRRSSWEPSVARTPPHPT
jgi:hypothetical protein